MRYFLSDRSLLCDLYADFMLVVALELANSALALVVPRKLRRTLPFPVPFAFWTLSNFFPTRIDFRLIVALMISIIPKFTFLITFLLHALSYVNAIEFSLIYLLLGVLFSL